ncbi:MAG: hypothetical protein ABJH85_03175 [Paracoccaceae bacterium]
MQNGEYRFVCSDEIMGGITFLMGGGLAKMYVDGYLGVGLEYALSFAEKIDI